MDGQGSVSPRVSDMRLSLKAMVVAGALFKAIVFLLISRVSLILRPYGGGYLASLTTLEPGYDPLNWPIRHH